MYKCIYICFKGALRAYYSRLWEEITLTMYPMILIIWHEIRLLINTLNKYISLISSFCIQLCSLWMNFHSIRHSYSSLRLLCSRKWYNQLDWWWAFEKAHNCDHHRNIEKVHQMILDRLIKVREKLWAHQKNVFLIYWLKN